MNEDIKMFLLEFSGDIYDVVAFVWLNNQKNMCG